MTETETNFYVKKNIRVEAVQLKATFDTEEAVQSWRELKEFTNHLVRVGSNSTFLVFDILHNSWIEFLPGDWIVKGIKGECYPVEEKVFEETYERHEVR